MKHNILIAVAHPDDELLGVGGTIIKHIKDGGEVSVLILADGETSRPGAGAKKINRRIRQIKQVAKSLKFKKIFINNLPDQKLDTLPLLEIIQIVERAVKLVKPEIVYTHSRFDLNLDHRIVFRAALTACRPRPQSCVKQILAFETPSATEWQAQDEANTFHPTKYVDISQVIKKKMAVIKIYRDEIRPFPHPRSLEAIENLAKFRGLEAGLKYAEAFQVIRMIE